MMRAGRIPRGGSGPVRPMLRGRRGLIVGGLALAGATPFARTARAAVEMTATKVRGSLSLKIGRSYGARPRIEIGPFERLVEVSMSRGIAFDDRNVHVGEIGRPIVTLWYGAAVAEELLAWYDNGKALREQAEGKRRFVSNEENNAGRREAELVIVGADDKSRWVITLGSAWVKELASRTEGGKEVVDALTISVGSIKLEHTVENDQTRRFDEQTRPVDELRQDPEG